MKAILFAGFMLCAIPTLALAAPPAPQPSASELQSKIAEQDDQIQKLIAIVGVLKTQRDLANDQIAMMTAESQIASHKVAAHAPAPPPKPSP